MSKFAILLSGLLSPTPRVVQQLAGARIIAADGGMVHAQILHLTPELWVGDFDSASPQLRAEFAQVEQLEFPPAKDKTDGELAIDAALERGATELLLIGALGGQTDHALAHLLLSIELAKRLPVVLTSGFEEAYPLLGELPLKLELPPQTKFSVLPFTRLRGLTVQGAQWPLVGVDIELGSSRTLSNRALGTVQIGLESGYGVLLIQWS